MPDSDTDPDLNRAPAGHEQPFADRRRLIANRRRLAAQPSPCTPKSPTASRWPSWETAGCVAFLKEGSCSCVTGRGRGPPPNGGLMQRWRTKPY